MELWCLLCEAQAVREVDVSVGVPGGLCREHLDMWMAKHPELHEPADS